MIEEVEKTSEHVGSISSGLGQVAAVFDGIMSAVHYILAFLAGMGLTETQAFVVVGIIFLVAFLTVLKFIALITKILILLLILWVVGSIIGLI